jgi:hypothetical protein
MPNACVRPLILAVGLAALSGCHSDPRIEIEVCGNLDVPEQIDAIRLSVLDDALTEVESGVIELLPREHPVLDAGNGRSLVLDTPRHKGADDGGPDVDGGTGEETVEILTLPVTASLPAPAGSGYVRAQGLLDGVEVARFDRRIPDFEEIERAELVLRKNCYGTLTCRKGQTCVSERCVLAPAPSDSPGCGGSGRRR